MTDPSPFSPDPLPAEALKEGEASERTTAMPQWVLNGTWRSVLLSDGMTEYFPFRGPENLTSTAAEELWSPVNGKPLVMLGPLGWGTSSFEKWVRHTSSIPPENIIVVDVAQLGNPAHAQNQHRRLGQQLAKQLGVEEPKGDTGQLIAQVFQAPKQDNTPWLLQIHHADYLHPENALPFFGHLRERVEAQMLNRFSIVLTGREKSKLEESEFSAFLPVCRVHRLATLDREDIAFMWETWGRQKPAAADVAKACIKWSGGQPLLARLFLDNLWHHPDMALDDIGRWLTEHPPSSHLRSWQAELANIIVKDAVQYDRVQHYANGGTDAVLTRDAYALYLSGWVQRKNGNGRWDLLSESHREWADPVLRDPGRFPPSRGAS